VAANSQRVSERLYNLLALARAADVRFGVNSDPRCLSRSFAFVRNGSKSRHVMGGTFIAGTPPACWTHPTVSLRRRHIKTSISVGV
jgi:hypothetical protein